MWSVLKMTEEIGNGQDKSQKKDTKNSIQLDINDEIAQGIYSNLALSNFNQEEVVIDFVYLQPHVNKGKVASRVILSPKNAKRLAIMLQDQIKKYEDKIGPIDDTPQLPGINLSFN
jgi:hypothetical protein